MTVQPCATRVPSRFRRAGWSLVLLAAWPLIAATAVRAQEGAEQPAAAQPAAEPEAAGAEPADQSLGGVILQSHSLGLVFYGLLGIFSLAAATVALERAVNLRKAKIIPTAFRRRLEELIRRQDATQQEFHQLCEGSAAPIASILKAGLLRAGRPLPEVEKAMEDAAAREMASLRSRNRPLSVVGSVAPLVGLLGTVVGMIIAFRISSQAGLGKAELLAEGIYLALMTTAAGLTIAIPCLLLAAWYNAAAERFLREIDECLLDTLPSFIRMEQQATRTDRFQDQAVTAGADSS